MVATHWRHLFIGNADCRASRCSLSWVATRWRHLFIGNNQHDHAAAHDLLALSPLVGDTYSLETSYPRTRWGEPQCCRHSLATPIHWKLERREALGQVVEQGRHSLATPIHWKPADASPSNVEDSLSRHSLATPIHWKPDDLLPLLAQWPSGRHSLATPIHWKPKMPYRLLCTATAAVATRWRHLFIGNKSDSSL